MEEVSVKRIKEDTSDRISELPECIIENILSRLDHPKTRVRVGVLSKLWFSLTASLPVLEFSSSDFWKEDSNRVCHLDVRDNFYKYVEHTVSRFYRQQNVMNADTFKLCTVSVTDAESKIIDSCLELILLKGVKELEIMMTWPANPYRLPDRLTSASSLKSLKVSHCMLPSSLMIDVANFKSLKVLHINDVCLNPFVIKHLTANCALLEELTVKDCYDFKNIYDFGRLQNLKKAQFANNSGLERIDIEAPNLCELRLCAGYMEGSGTATSVNLGLCKQLRTLLLRGFLFPTSTGLSDFLSNFPILEKLTLFRRDQCSRLTISSPSFRKFELYDNCDLEDIDIITPNILLFSYANACDYYNPDKLLNINSGESIARMECHIINDVDTLWFQKLRRFLEKSDRFKVLNLDNNLFGKISVDFEQLKAFQLPPYELEHVKLNLAEWKRNEFLVVDGILWCCRPRSLSLTFKFSSLRYEVRSHILKYISDKLLKQEDQDTTNIRIEWSFPSKAKIYFSWNSMMPELPGRYKQTLTFVKEEVATKK